MLAELVISCVPWLTGETVCVDQKSGEFWKIKHPIEQVVPERKRFNEIAPLILVAGADLATTEYGLSHGQMDHNLLSQSRPLMYGAKALQVALVDRWTLRLRKQKKFRTARVLKYGAIGLNLFAVGWNVHKIREAR